MKLLKQFMDEVWNQGDFTNLAQMVADPYAVISDPGDPWNGQSIGFETFKARVGYTRNAFPDVSFQIEEAVEGQDVTALRWMMTGTHLGDLPMLPATGKQFAITGMTFYVLKNGLIAGHRQNFDQLGFLAQIGALSLTSRV